MNPEINYLTEIITPMLLNKEALKIEKTTDERGVLLTLTIAKEDMGRVIGKEGQTAKAIRVLLRQYGGIIKSMISLKINEPYSTNIPVYSSDKDYNLPG